MNRPIRLVQLLVAVLAFALVAACTPPSGDGGTVPPPPPSSAPPSVEPASPDVTPGTPAPTGSPDASTSPSAGPTASPPGTTIVRAYFAIDEGLVPVLRVVPATRAVATAAMEELLAFALTPMERTARPAFHTLIPAGTRLLGLRIDGGVATVNLSREFEAGGGSLALMGRLAQVVFTLTQFPTVQSVSFELDGEPVTIFGGEGVMLDEPVGRAVYHDWLLPEIFVDRPAWGAAIGNPARITGLTRVFEATFQAQLMDDQGRVLVSETVMATCGTGCWGTFDVTLRYTVGEPQWGTLRVLEYSARDGTPQNVRDYPVWLTPAS